MANSLEIRLPFLDYRIIDFAARIPPQWKLKGLHEKHILRQAFKGSLPGTISQRVKHPYRAPIREAFFSDKGCRYVDDLLSEDYVRKAGYFDEKKSVVCLVFFAPGVSTRQRSFKIWRFSDSLNSTDSSAIYQRVAAGSPAPDSTGKGCGDATGRRIINGRYQLQKWSENTMQVDISIREKVYQFIREMFLAGAGLESVQEDESFLENGIIDSTGVMELVAFLEDTFGITVEDEELIPENLDSIDYVVAYLERKTA